MDSDDISLSIAIGCATVVVASIIWAIAACNLYYTGQETEFARVCTASHRSVIYAEVNGETVSECK